MGEQVEWANNLLAISVVSSLKASYKRFTDEPKKYVVIAKLVNLWSVLPVAVVRHYYSINDIYF